MSGIAQIRAAIRRLEAHFEKVEVPPPASPEALASLREHAPGLPPQLRAFYALANGIRVGLRDFNSGWLYSAEEALESYRIGFGHHAPPVRHLLPIRGDGCGSSDCIVAAGPIGVGSVVFWDHEVWDKAAYFLGSTFARYIEMWSEALVHEFLPNGERHPQCVPKELDAWPWLAMPERRHPWPHHREWLFRRDPGLVRLIAAQDVGSLVAEQD
jgi:hypothetical protein